MEIIIQEFEGPVTYVATGSDLDIATRNLELARIGIYGCLHLVRSEPACELVYYGGVDSMTTDAEMSPALLKACCNALQLDPADFETYIKGGAEC